MSPATFPPAPEPSPRALFMALAVCIVLAVALLAAFVLAGCAGTTTTLRGEYQGLAAEVTFQRAAALCEPGEAWSTCLPKCAAQEAGALDPPQPPALPR